MTNAHTRSDKRLSRAGAALLAVGGLLVVGFTRLSWMTVTYFDDRAGGGEADISGAAWSAEASAVSLLLFVSAIAALALRRLGRRIVGVVAAVAAAGASLAPLRLLVQGPDPERAHTILTAGYEDLQSRSDAIPSWAEITGIDVHTVSPVLMLLGCVLALVGAVIVVARPGTDTAKLNKYERETVRREKITQDLSADPDSGRVMWDALEADLDPTDLGDVQEGPGKRR
ncbi:TIGR02234 family membrane protein [Corynebacterium timonense]|uniref:Trp region conserved hypothetical membrane protein n=1 Tax=Corynebacterium timonense TaxID=441500 RepID=A0A1H1MTE2_9CORY|nr:TIGR02234 family membrane protein [Corynebacterium timonense]SDR90131.1 trp region conserved hypothetical membrane protein [Corynebacterium timonense]